MCQHHRTTRLIPPWINEVVEIDTGMVSVVRELWTRDWQTLACCQDSGEAVAAEREHGKPSQPTGHRGFIEYHKGWAWLKMPTEHALGLLGALTRTSTLNNLAPSQAGCRSCPGGLWCSEQPRCVLSRLGLAAGRRLD